MTPTHSVFPVPPGIFNGTHMSPLCTTLWSLAKEIWQHKWQRSTQCYSMLFQWNETKQLQKKVLTYANVNATTIDVLDVELKKETKISKMGNYMKSRIFRLQYSPSWSSGWFSCLSSARNLRNQRLLSRNDSWTLFSKVIQNQGYPATRPAKIMKALKSLNGIEWNWMVLARRRQGKAATIPDHPICHPSWWPCPCPSFAKRLACRQRHLGAPSRCNSSIRLEGQRFGAKPGPKTNLTNLICFTVFTVWLSSFRRFFMSSLLQDAAHVDMSLSPNLVLIFKINSLRASWCVVNRPSNTAKVTKWIAMGCHSPDLWVLKMKSKISESRCMTWHLPKQPSRLLLCTCLAISCNVNLPPNTQSLQLHRQ